MVFLSVAAHDAVGTGRRAQLFVLARQGSGGVLGNHIPRIGTRIIGEERRKTALTGNQQIHPAFRNASEIRKGQREEIEGDGQGLPMEIAG